MTFTTFRVALAAAITVSSGVVAFAGTMQTRATLENATANVDFLDRSSRLALDHSDNARVRTYARGVASEQTLAANALYDLSQSTRDQRPAAHARGTGPEKGQKAAAAPSPCQIGIIDAA